MRWVYEFLIFFYLIVVGGFFIEVATGWKRFAHKRLLAVMTCVLALGWTLIFYGSFIETKRLVVREYEVELPQQTGERLKAAVVSDFHVGPYRDEQWVQRVVETVMASKPEIIFLVGDFIFSDAQQAHMLEPLSGLFAPYGVFAVTGNHDYDDETPRLVIDTLTRLGIRVLENESVQLSVKESGREIVVAGVSDLWSEGNMYQALDDVTEDQQVILLSHNPDAVLYSNAGLADVVIAGHTHGGQIRLPWIGSLARVPTQLGNTYDKGLFFFSDQRLFITPGVGEMGTRARLWNPPEVSLLSISF